MFSRGAPNDFLSVKRQHEKVSHLTNRAIENIVYKYTQSFDKRMSPHKLRHTYATNLAKVTDGDIHLIMNQPDHSDYIHEVANQAGHSNIHTTLLYTNPTKNELIQKMNKL